MSTDTVAPQILPNLSPNHVKYQILKRQNKLTKQLLSHPWGEVGEPTVIRKSPANQTQKANLNLFLVHQESGPCLTYSQSLRLCVKWWGLRGMLGRVKKQSFFCFSVFDSNDLSPIHLGPRIAQGEPSHAKRQTR